MKESPHWINGFASAIFLSSLVLLGVGLWGHNPDELAGSSILLLISGLVWMMSILEATK